MGTDRRRRTGGGRRALLVLAATLAAAVGSVAVATLTPDALGQTTPNGTPATADTQRWAPPLSGPTSGLDLADGTARLSTARSEPADLRGARRQGFLDLGEHRFGGSVNRISVRTDADTPPGTAVEVDVRGQEAGGRWSEWTPLTGRASVVLDEPTRVVGVRLVLVGGSAGAGPVVRTLEVDADRVAAGPRVVTPRATYRIFATREGLVGGTTANGHRIVADDQFAALPSRRSLAPNGRGDYSVRICTDARRCATVPVWDVGPWNTTDDYWNPAPIRQAWKELPQGRPQAQAAYQDKHNGGRDGFGRLVVNPAGIDLADGTFRGLGLRTNGFVTVEYLWTGGGQPVGHVISPLSVPVRPGPAPVGDVGVLGVGAQVDVECQAQGPPLVPHGPGTPWLRLGAGQYVPAAVVAGVPPLPPCR